MDNNLPNHSRSNREKTFASHSISELQICAWVLCIILSCCIFFHIQSASYCMLTCIQLRLCTCILFRHLLVSNCGCALMFCSDMIVSSMFFCFCLPNCRFPFITLYIVAPFVYYISLFVVVKRGESSEFYAPEMWLSYMGRQR